MEPKSVSEKRQFEPTIMVIFGATGDLAKRKIFPALLDLFNKGSLPKKFKVVAVGRREFTDEAYQAFVREAIEQKRKDLPGTLENFIRSISYVEGKFEDNSVYEKLGARLEATDNEFNICSNKLFYLAVPPTLYEMLLNKLSVSGLTIPCRGNGGWTRILIEKPFGNDVETARKLDRMLAKHFEESQIFRIDHYLAKETLQNILAFRFSNAIFEPLWNRKYIERIEVRMMEEGGVGARGSLYDGLGALRDVGQNHLLAMLSLITMEYPDQYSAESIRKQRAKILRKLIAPKKASFSKRVIRGQYENYASEANVNAESLTETFFSVTAELSDKRWRGVPIELTAGKALHKGQTYINVYFKDVDCGPGDIKCNRNTLTFKIQPDEGISISFWAKKPGFNNHDTYEKTLSFNYADSIDSKLIPDAYERVLYDCIRGDQTLFASTMEVEAAWKFITEILNKWSAVPLRVYKKGSTLADVLKTK